MKSSKPEKPTIDPAILELRGHVHLPTRTLFLDGEVTEGMAGYVARALHILDLGEDPITIYLSTNGGSRPAALAIYDLIRQCKSHVRVIGYCHVRSAGVLILQAGDERLLHRHASILLHPGHSSSGDGQDVDTLAFAKNTLINRDTMYAILAKRMGIGLKEALEKYDDDNWFSAKQAVRLGLADRVLP